MGLDKYIRKEIIGEGSFGKVSRDLKVFKRLCRLQLSKAAAIWIQEAPQLSHHAIYLLLNAAPRRMLMMVW